jgi:hypothetical protein
MPLFNPYFATRRWLTFGLVIGGAAAGAVLGLVLTRLGKIVAGAPPATLANYAWNAAVFGLLAAAISPIVSWNALRRVPLWRTVIEPLGYAVAGGVTAVLAGSGVLLLALPPIGLAFGLVRLSRRYPEATALPSTRPADER